MKFYSVLVITCFIFLLGCANDLSTTSESTNDVGGIRVFVENAQTGKIISNAQVTLYDDALYEIAQQKSNADGSVLFENVYLSFSPEVVSLYQKKGKKAPSVYIYDTRTYAVEVFADGYEPQVIAQPFVEGEGVTIHAALTPAAKAPLLSGNMILSESSPSSSAGGSLGDGNVELFLAPQPIIDRSRCSFRVERVTVDPLPEDFKKFTLKGFIRTTRYCTGSFRVLLPSFGKSVLVKGKGIIPFTFDSLVTSNGNAAGGLQCPFLEISELTGLGDSVETGISASVQFRLPLLACNDPMNCLNAASCRSPKQELFEGETTRPVSAEEGYCETVDPVTGERVRSTEYVGRTACNRYFNGDCGKSSRGMTCGFEELCDPVKKGAPSGGGKDLIQQQTSQDVGQQCCFCAYDAKSKDSEGLQASCNDFFNKKIGPFASDNSFACEVKEMIPIHEWDTKLPDLREKYSCKNPIAIFLTAHGTSDSFPEEYTPSDQFPATCKTVSQFTSICATTFPNNDIKLGSDSCMFLQKQSEIDKYFRDVQSYVGEDQTIEVTGNILVGYGDPEKEQSCTLKRTIRITRNCFSVIPGLCREEGAECGTGNALGVPYSCINKNGKQTIQRCCETSETEIVKQLLQTNNGMFSAPGEECPDPKISGCYIEGIECETAGTTSCRNGAGKVTTQTCCEIKVGEINKFISQLPGVACPTSTNSLSCLPVACMTNGRIENNKCVYDPIPKGTSCSEYVPDYCDGKGRCTMIGDFECQSDSDCPNGGQRCDMRSSRDGRFLELVTNSCNKDHHCVSDEKRCESGEVCTQTSSNSAACVKAS